MQSSSGPCGHWLPRTRGDRPCERWPDDWRSMAPPHTRGSTSKCRFFISFLRGSPAHAGIDPGRAYTDRTGHWLPRRPIHCRVGSFTSRLARRRRSEKHIVHVHYVSTIARQCLADRCSKTMTLNVRCGSLRVPTHFRAQFAAASLKRRNTPVTNWSRRAFPRRIRRGLIEA